MSSLNNLLQIAVSQGIIDLSLVEKQVKMTQREQFLKQHPYEIWQGKNGSWYTYLPDKEKGRILKRKSTRKAIEDEIVVYWKAEEENPTIKEVFEEWNNYRLELGKISKSSYDRYQQTFNRFYKDFGKKKIKNVNEADIEEFLERQVMQYKLTAKGFADLKTITRGFLKRAKKRKLIDFNIEIFFQEMDTSDIKFNRHYKEDYEEVFDEDEMTEVIQYLESDLDLINAALLLMFLTGIRVGEIVVLKHSDFSGNTFKVRRTETRYRGADGKYVYGIKESPKSQAGIRTAIIPTDYAWITEALTDLSPSDDYVFVKNGKRITTNVIRRRIKRVCERLDIYPKSPHKIRKTYGSILLDNHVDNATIIQQMGHTDISCTERHYHRNRKKIEEKTRALSELPEFQAM